MKVLQKFKKLLSLEVLQNKNLNFYNTKGAVSLLETAPFYIQFKTNLL